jgi:hypothetical protein
MPENFRGLGKFFALNSPGNVFLAPSRQKAKFSDFWFLPLRLCIFARYSASLVAALPL